jgi:hypothetical protein
MSKGCAPYGTAVAESEEGASPDAPGLLAHRPASGDAALPSQVKRQCNSRTPYGGMGPEELFSTWKRSRIDLGGSSH